MEVTIDGGTLDTREDGYVVSVVRGAGLDGGWMAARPGGGARMDESVGESGEAETIVETAMEVIEVEGGRGIGLTAMWPSVRCFCLLLSDCC